MFLVVRKARLLIDENKVEYLMLDGRCSALPHDRRGGACRRRRRRRSRTLYTAWQQSREWTRGTTATGGLHSAATSSATGTAASLASHATPVYTGDRTSLAGGYVRFVVPCGKGARQSQRQPQYTPPTIVQAGIHRRTSAVRRVRVLRSAAVTRVEEEKQERSMKTQRGTTRPTD